MAQFLRNEGAYSVFLTPDGQEVRVENGAAQSYMPTPDPTAQAVPVEALPPEPPPAIETLPPPVQGFAPEPAALPPQAPEVAAPVPVAPPVPVTTPAPAVEEPPPLEFAPDVVDPPSILPEQVARTNVELAGQVNQANQEKADSVYRSAVANVGAAGDIVAGSEALDAALQQQEDDRRAEAQQRLKDEAVLSDDYGRAVKRYASFKVDPNRGVGSDRQAMAWIGAAIAGIGQVISGRDPSENPAIKLIFQQMDRRIQIQMAERDALGNAVGMKKEALGDFRTATKSRLGEYDLRMAAELEKYARMVDRVKTKLGSVAEREAAEQVISSMRAESAIYSQGAAAKDAQALANARAARAKAAAAQAAAIEKNRQWMAQHKVRFDPETNSYVPDDRFADPDALLDTEGKILANDKARRDLANPAATEGSIARVKDEAARSLNDFGGRLLTRTVKGPDGQPVQVPAKARSEKEGQELRTTAAGVATITRASQLLRTAIKNHGGSSSMVGSAEYQEAQSLLNQIDLANKDIQGLGVIQGADMKILAGVRGGVDPASFIKDASPGLAAMEKRAVEKYNAELRAKSDYFDSDKAEIQKPADVAPAQAIEKQPIERVRSFTTPDPSVEGDPQAVAADAEQKLADLDVFLKRDKPSVDTMEAALAQVSAARLPATTKAAMLARLNEAIGARKDKSYEGRQKLQDAAEGYGGQGRLIPEDILFGLPKKKAAK